MLKWHRCRERTILMRILSMMKQQHGRKRRWGVISSFSTLFHGFFAEPTFTRGNHTSYNNSRSWMPPLLWGQTLWPDTMLCCWPWCRACPFDAYASLYLGSGNCCTISIFIKITLIFFSVRKGNSTALMLNICQIAKSLILLIGRTLTMLLYLLNVSLHRIKRQLLLSLSIFWASQKSFDNRMQWQWLLL